LQHYDVGYSRNSPTSRAAEDGGTRPIGVSPAMVVVAGMEGALPSVVRGLVTVPVIGVPTSTGYGYGGHGQAALNDHAYSRVLRRLTVVNIDNGFGAGATAALVANQVALARSL